MMIKRFAYVDPYITDPAFHCFNGLVEELGIPGTYHMPGMYGVHSLHEHQSHVDAYIVVGSPSMVTDSEEWHTPLAEFLVSELKKHKPILAGCFGHQLLCKAFGSEVGYFNDTRDKILGFREMRIKNNFWNFTEGETFKMAMSHRQIVTKLGPELVSVGEGMGKYRFENDIVIHRELPLLTTQAHPEASRFFARGNSHNSEEEVKLLEKKLGYRFIRRFFKYFNGVRESHSIHETVA